MHFGDKCIIFATQQRQTTTQLTMKLTQVTVGGYTNIDKVSISLSKICALLAFNNYGKSNVLSAIMFGLNFISIDTTEKRKRMASSWNLIPINNRNAGQDFHFQIEGEANVNGENTIIIYGYSFAWPHHNSAPYITSEFLKIKKSGEAKFTSHIKRENNKCTYLSSTTGRCSSILKVDGDQLAINKLSNYDELFYIDVLKKILNLKIVEVEALADPKTFFRTISITDSNDAFASDINNVPDFASSAHYIYNLKKSNADKYNLFLDAVTHLIPSITDFEPVKIDLKKQVARLDGEKNIPFHLPEFVYDIRVKERNLNQQVTIGALSSGTKKIFYLLLMTIAAEINKIPLILMEELENSIHPSLFQKLLTVLDTLAGDTKIVLTSHSPYLLQYLRPESLYVGIPNEADLAIFKKLKNSKIKNLMRDADTYEMSLGDYLFDMLLDVRGADNDVVSKFFE